MKTNEIVEKIIDRKYYEYAEKEFDDFYLVPVELSWEVTNQLGTNFNMKSLTSVTR